jgi:hypothetical protein
MLQNAPWQFVPAEIGLEAQLNVCLDRIGAAILQLIGAELVHQTNAAAFLMLINQNSAALFADGVQRQLELGAAVAAQAVKDVACQTLGMNANKRRRSGDIAEPEDDGLFHAGIVSPFKTENPETSETTREIGFRRLDELKRCTGRHSEAVVSLPSL